MSEVAEKRYETAQLVVTPIQYIFKMLRMIDSHNAKLLKLALV